MIDVYCTSPGKRRWSFSWMGAMEDRGAGQLEGGAEGLSAALDVRGNERRRVQCFV